MKYRTMKYLLGQLSEEQLDQNVQVFNPIYGRIFGVTALTSRKEISADGEEGQKVLVLAQEAES